MCEGRVVPTTPDGSHPRAEPGAFLLLWALPTGWNYSPASCCRWGKATQLFHFLPSQHCHLPPLPAQARIHLSHLEWLC